MVGALELFQDTQPDLKYVYDEKLSYVSGVSKFRADNNQLGSAADTSVFPLFIFSRSVLRHENDGISRRAVTECARKVNTELGTAEIFNFMHGVFDIRFMYVVPHAEQLETFEICYLSERGISDRKSFELDYSQLPDTYVGDEDLGKWTYFLKFNGELQEKIIEDEGNYYKAVMGEISVRGWYFLMRGTMPVITQINFSVLNDKSKLWCEHVITP